MSIWATCLVISDDPDDAPGLVRRHDGSHLYPSADGPRAEVDLAEIPAWCVPGHELEHDSDAVGPWLRLGVDLGSEPTEGTFLWAPASLDEVAVRTLRDALSRWLDTPKVRPEEIPDDAA